MAAEALGAVRLPRAARAVRCPWGMYGTTISLVIDVKITDASTEALVHAAQSAHVAASSAKSRIPTMSSDLGDEWRVLHLLRDEPCVVKPAIYDDTIDALPKAHLSVRCEHLSCMQWKGESTHARLNNEVAQLFGEAGTCNAVRRTLESVSAKVRGHDLWARISCSSQLDLAARLPICAHRHGRELDAKSNQRTDRKLETQLRTAAWCALVRLKL